jgi:parvulin-like peptidyl-prolyl isomerase
MPSSLRWDMRFNMHRRIAIFIIFAFLACSRIGPIARAEVIDKIAALINGRIITLSDVRKEHEIQAVLGNKPESDDALLQSMIDNDLLEEEMAQYPGLDVSEDEIDERMKSISDFQGVDPSEIRNAASRSIQRYKYLSLRYRQFIMVSNEEIANYYNTKFVPEATKNGVAVPPLGEAEDGIRINLFEEKVLSEIEDSLKALRERSTIEILQ